MTLQLLTSYIYAPWFNLGINNNGRIKPHFRNIFLVEKMVLKLWKCKGNQSWIFIGRTDCWSWNSNILTTWCEELTHWKRSWCWEWLKVGREGDDKGWNGWMASLTQWTWVRARSRSWWWIGKPGMGTAWPHAWHGLQSKGSQRVGHDWMTKVSWIDDIGRKTLFPTNTYKLLKICN